MFLFFFSQFEINHLNDEHLVSVKGCYDNISGVIQALQFETNQRSSEVMGYDDNGNKFTLEVSGNKITGFHGSAEANLKSLGAYFTPLAPIKLEYQGSTTGGRPWDHGIYTGVRKVYVTHIVPLGYRISRSTTTKTEKWKRVKTGIC